MFYHFNAISKLGLRHGSRQRHTETPWPSTGDATTAAAVRSTTHTDARAYAHTCTPDGTPPRPYARARTPEHTHHGRRTYAPRAHVTRIRSSVVARRRNSQSTIAVCTGTSATAAVYHSTHPLTRPRGRKMFVSNTFRYALLKGNTINL